MNWREVWGKMQKQRNLLNASEICKILDGEKLRNSCIRGDDAH